MGTSGSGRLSDYGLKDEIDICDKVIENELLENCGDYDYTKKNSSARIKEGARIKLKADTRIVAYEITSDISLGALSTKYEKIRTCFNKGYQFDGEIVKIDNTGGITSIYVTIIGTKAKK